jgi:hypothetical protein
MSISMYLPFFLSFSLSLTLFVTVLLFTNQRKYYLDAIDHGGHPKNCDTGLIGAKKNFDL